jgi:hypothetical protein
MKKITLLLFAFILAKSGFTQSGIPVSVEEFKEGKYLVKIIALENNTYGYDIYLVDKLIVNQTSKPFSTISKGFKNKDNIRKVVKYHINKLEQGEQGRLFMTYDEAIKIDISKDDL